MRKNWNYGFNCWTVFMNTFPLKTSESFWRVNVLFNSKNLSTQNISIKFQFMDSWRDTFWSGSICSMIVQIMKNLSNLWQRWKPSQLIWKASLMKKCKNFKGFERNTKISQLMSTKIKCSKFSINFKIILNFSVY